MRGKPQRRGDAHRPACCLRYPPSSIKSGTATWPLARPRLATLPPASRRKSANSESDPQPALGDGHGAAADQHPIAAQLALEIAAASGISLVELEPSASQPSAKQRRQRRVQRPGGRILGNARSRREKTG